MKSRRLLMAMVALLLFAASNAQIKNAITESVRINGNYGMCESNIEKTGSIKKIVKVDWNVNSKIAVITYDKTKTNLNEILKRIALAGYDSNQVLAPNDAYNNLPGCCQYDRESKTLEITETKKEDVTEKQSIKPNPLETSKVDQAKIGIKKQDTVIEPKQEDSQLKAVFDNYFSIKDALVKTNEETASSSATNLLSAIHSIKMELLTSVEHTVLMNILKDITFDAEHIAGNKDIGYQGKLFSSLSANMLTLLKVSKQETPTYFQHCPMANNGKGADWLRKKV